VAYVYDPNLDDEEKKQGNAPENPYQPPTGPSISGQATPNSSAPQQPPSSRQFQNLQSYLDANQGKDFGKQVANRVDETTNQARSQLNTASQRFADDVERGTTRYDRDFVSGALANPAGFVANRPASDYERFTAMRDAQYRGPNAATDSSDFSKAASTAERAYRQGENLKTEGGRFALLDEFFRRPTYSRGEKSLDNLLLQADPENQQALQAASANARNLPAESQAKIAEANARANEARAATEEARRETRQALADAKTRTQAELEAARQAKIRALEDVFLKARENLGTGRLTEEQARQFGFDAPIATYGVDPRKFLTDTFDPDKDTVTAYQAADPEMRAKVAALARLSGVDEPGFIEGWSPSDAEITNPGATFNFNAFKQAAENLKNQARQEAFDSAIRELALNPVPSNRHPGIITNAHFPKPASIDEALQMLQKLRYELRTLRPNSEERLRTQWYINGLESAIAKANTVAGKLYGKFVGYQPDRPVSNQPIRTIRDRLIATPPRERAS
jgi:hypothetical protein